MKPVSFDYERPDSIEAAVKLLVQSAGSAKILAGGQSLGPMLNMRLVRPALLIDISRISELSDVTDDGDALIFGACITHVDIEDRQIPDASSDMMPTVAAGIAHRAIRNKGTIGGSLVHADPAADWMTALSALGAEAVVFGPLGERRISLDQFMQSAFETVLGDEEILISIRVPKFSPDARCGYFKFCRKTGEFADAMSAVVVDPERKVARAVIGATDSRPIVIPDANNLISVPEMVDNVIVERNLTGDAYKAQTYRVALWRALEQVRLA